MNTNEIKKLSTHTLIKLMETIAEELRIRNHATTSHSPNNDMKLFSVWTEEKDSRF